MKRCLIIRLGAFGDCIVISPVIKELKALGYYIIMNTSDRGMKIFANNPNIDEFIEHDESIPLEDIEDHWEKLQKEIPHDKFINFSRSIEHNLSRHPTDPEYNWTKRERLDLCNRNYYEEAFDWGKVAVRDETSYAPDLYFTAKEESEAQKHIRVGNFNILWNMSGSSHNKAYPWAEYVIGEIFNNYRGIHIITTGDEKCQIIESHDSKITNLAGKIDMRMSMCLTKHVDLVISPDTGVLHASGGYTTPKIGLFGSTTRENITKHFLNDYSIESEIDCAPCFYLIYDHNIQCPIDKATKSPFCMAVGIQPERLYNQITKVLPDDRKVKRQNIPADVSCV